MRFLIIIQIKSHKNDMFVSLFIIGYDNAVVVPLSSQSNIKYFENFQNLCK